MQWANYQVLSITNMSYRKRPPGACVGDCGSAFSCHQLCVQASAGVIQLYIMRMLLLRILLDADKNDVPCVQGQVHAL